MSVVKRLVVFLAALAAAGCQTVQTTQPGVVGIERPQTMLLSSETVNRSADKAYRQVLAGAAKRNQLNRDPVQLERVRAIAGRLIAQTAAFRPDAPRWQWEVNVIESKERNAWCMPGGKIAFYSGLIETLALSDEEIAAIMGHEIAHALREHGRERASQAIAQGIGLAVIGAALRAPEAAMDLSELVLELTLNLPNSRTAEQEADRIGVELAARAGYDPRAALSLWEKMQKRARIQPPEFLSTHPSYETRLADLRSYAARVMPLYEEALRRR